MNQILGIYKGVELGLDLGFILETYTILINQQFPCDFTGVMVWLALGRGVQTRSWRATVLQSLAPNPIKHTQSS